MQILISITNNKCNVAATKTVLTRFDGVENSIFSLFPFFLPKPVSHLKLYITCCYNFVIEWNLGIMCLNLNAQKTIDICKLVLGTYLSNKLYRFSKLRHWHWYCHCARINQATVQSSQFLKGNPCDSPKNWTLWSSFSLFLVKYLV